MLLIATMIAKRQSARLLALPLVKLNILLRLLFLMFHTLSLAYVDGLESYFGSQL